MPAVFIIYSVLLYMVVKVLCVCYTVCKEGSGMYKRQHLSSIPEHLERDGEEEEKSRKWVPKKKHDVLKAKYKCLKKLFQIYDASVIGMLPERDGESGDHEWEGDRRHSRRKRRSCGTGSKIDAAASSIQLPQQDPPPASPQGSMTSALVRDLRLQCSCSTQILDDKPGKQCDEFELKLPSSSLLQETSCSPLQRQYLNYQTQPRPTRFQIFVQRVFGTRRPRYPPPPAHTPLHTHTYAASDNDIGCKRRRHGFRFRRLRKCKKTQSELDMTELRTPVILSYVQTVQRSCLTDRTPRHCPIAGCDNMFYGIINYNDHLNLCHFMERKYVCHYCHEGFESGFDKQSHEYEHIGLSKLAQHTANVSANASQKASNTQTDPEMMKSDVREEKLKKIVSFFDKIADTEQMLAELKDNRYSESNLRSGGTSTAGSSNQTRSSAGGHRGGSCGDLVRGAGGATSVQCHVCGEEFTYRRQLSLHVELEHGVHDKFAKFHSCAGIVGCRAHAQRRTTDRVKAEAGKINIESVGDVRRTATSSTLTPDSCSQLTPTKSCSTMSCEPSTNIIYYESGTSVRPSPVAGYSWEPGTQIIRV